MKIFNYLGWTALHWACDSGEKDIVRMLIRNFRADPFMRNSHGSSPIHLAISNGHTKVVEDLLSYKRELTSSFNDKTGWFPIHTAAFYKKVDCLLVLIKYGASVMEKTRESELSTDCLTPFHLATFMQLQKKSTIIREREEVRRNFTRSLSQPGDEDFIREATPEDDSTKACTDVLLASLPQEAIAVVDDNKYGTVLHCLAACDHYEGVKLILEEPFLHPPDIENSKGVTPLLMALNLRSLKSAKELLRKATNAIILKNIILLCER